MSYPYFSTEQLIPYFISGTILLIATFYFNRNEKLGVSLLFIGALGMGFFIALLDPYLILWDEQYHALVAKNLLENPLRPTLFLNPILEVDYSNWTANEVWLHKQPLFLWQMALSLKIFGINELAVRIPSIIMHAVLPVLIYRIGKICLNANIGFYAGLFLAIAYYPLDLVAGRLTTDHNDVAFLFYITASFWAWFEYNHSNKIYWLVLIGLFSGCAILVKWLVGLLVYFAWTIIKLVNANSLSTLLRSIKPILQSLLITILIALPWQLFILHQYPVESNYEFILNSKHFFEDVELHGGGLLFHFIATKRLYGSGDIIPLLTALGILIMYIKLKSRDHKIMIFASIAAVYAFYTMATTKMMSFCIIVCPFIFLAWSSTFEFIFSWIRSKITSEYIINSIKVMVMIPFCFLLNDLNKIQTNHTVQASFDAIGRNKELTEMKLIRQIQDRFSTNKHVVFNMNITTNGHIPLMFYTDLTAYDYIPTEEQIASVRSSGYDVAVLDIGNLPEYIRIDKDIDLIQISSK